MRKGVPQFCSPEPRTRTEYDSRHHRILAIKLRTRLPRVGAAAMPAVALNAIPGNEDNDPSCRTTAAVATDTTATTTSTTTTSTGTSTTTATPTTTPTTRTITFTLFLSFSLSLSLCYFAQCGHVLFLNPFLASGNGIPTGFGWSRVTSEPAPPASGAVAGAGVVPASGAVAGSGVVSEK